MLFTFPSRYSFAIGLPGVFSLAGWSRRIRAGLLVPRVTQVPLGRVRIHVRNSHPLRCNFPDASTLHTRATAWSYYPARALPHGRFGLFPVRSPLLGESRLFSLPQGTKMFQFPWFASLPQVRIAALQAAGLSHSEIPGSKVICTYPGLIAAYHVLHRLREPRHPPDALTCFRQLPAQPRKEGRNRSYFQL